MHMRMDARDHALPMNIRVSVSMAIYTHVHSNPSAAGKIRTTDPPAFQLAILWASVGNSIPATFWVLYYILKDEALKAEVIREGVYVRVLVCFL
jgi:hypothetical protein